jgi:hypothetical protein
MGNCANGGAVHWHIAPAEKPLALFLDDPLQNLFTKAAMLRVRRQENHPHAIFIQVRKQNSGFSALLCQELVGYLQQNAGSISRLWIAATRTPVPQVRQNLQGLADDVIRPGSVEVGNKTDATTVLFKLRVV